MLRSLAVFCALCCLTVARAEAVSLPTVPLSYYPTPLTALDRAGVIAQVMVPVSDREPYASFFLEAAVVRGTFVLTESLTARFQQALIGAAAATGVVVESDPGQWPEVIEKVKSNENTGPDQMKSLRHGADQLEQMIGPLTAAVEKTPGLVGRIPGLVSGAPDAFPGKLSKLKLARTIGSLKETSEDLKDSVGTMKQTLDHLRAVIAAVRR